MDLFKKTALLDRIYKIYDEFSGNLDVACKKHCAHCCTCNVTMTTLEGYKIVEYIMRSEHYDLNDRFARLNNRLNDRLKQNLSKKRFQPKITTNRLAELFALGMDVPDEDNNFLWGNCPLLTGDECPVYPVRPFGCRCFVSKQDCRQQGSADVDPFVITVNNVFLQYIEHIDSHGYSGNLTDILLFLEPENIRQAYRTNTVKNPDNNLVPNSMIKFLLIPPEDRNRIVPILEKLGSIKV